MDCGAILTINTLLNRNSFNYFKHGGYWGDWRKDTYLHFWHFSLIFGKFKENEVCFMIDSNVYVILGKLDAYFIHFFIYHVYTSDALLHACGAQLG